MGPELAVSLFTNIVFVTLSAVILLVFVHRPTSGALALLIAIAFVPYLTILGTSFRVELILLPSMLALLVLRRSRLGMAVPPVVWPLLVLWFCIFAVSAFRLMNEDVNSILWSNVYAFLRPALYLLLFYNLPFSRDESLRITRYFAYSAIPLGILAVGQSLGNPLATWLTIEAYTSPFRTSVANLLEETGRILRATSVFETPAYAATYFLLSLGTALLWIVSPPIRLRYTQQIVLLFSAFAAAIGGLLTLSATFVAGISLLALWMLLLVNRRAKSKTLLVSMVVLGILIALGGSLLKKDSQISGSLAYQVNRVVSLNLLGTRYDAEKGILADTMTAVLERPLLGWGWTRRGDVFLGDSIYVVLLYYGGVLALGLLGAVLLATVPVSLRTGFLGRILLLWLVVMLGGGFGSPTFFIPRLGGWWWALVGMVYGVYRRRHLCR